MEYSSDSNLPREFNDNDIMVFNAYITKYICRYKQFDRKDFLRALIEDEFGKTNAYPIKEKQFAIIEIGHAYNQLIKFCLKKLQDWDLVYELSTENVNLPCRSTDKLKKLCPSINRYLMPSVESLVIPLQQIEQEIRSNPELFKATTTLFNLLAHKRTVSRHEIPINQKFLDILTDLVVVDISLSGQISLSNIGELIFTRIR